jgi:putative DNA primase/helicase
MSDNPDKINVDAIPTELRDRPQWVVWRLEWRKGEKKPTKPPRQVTGSYARTNDPSTWTTFDAAFQAVRSGGFVGLGYVFAPDDPYTGTDLDRVIDDKRVVEPWAADIIQRLASYTELSPSGNGLHVIVRGSLPGPGRKKGQLEMYDRERFFTFTGRLWTPARGEIKDRPAPLESIYRQYFGDDKPVEQSRQPVEPVELDTWSFSSAPDRRRTAATSRVFGTGTHRHKATITARRISPCARCSPSGPGATPRASIISSGSPG